MLRSAENDRAQVLRCIVFGRDSMDLLCDSLGLQCHQVRAALDHLDHLADAGLVRPLGSAGTASLTFAPTEHEAAPPHAAARSAAPASTSGRGA
jgi:hypothetical protein